MWQWCRSSHCLGNNQVTWHHCTWVCFFLSRAGHLPHAAQGILSAHHRTNPHLHSATKVWVASVVSESLQCLRERRLSGDCSSSRCLCGSFAKQQVSLSQRALWIIDIILMSKWQNKLRHIWATFPDIQTITSHLIDVSFPPLLSFAQLYPHTVPATCGVVLAATHLVCC